MIRKIGILTGGGDCPGLNAVIRAVVKTAVLKYGYEVLGYKDGYRGLVLNEFVRLTAEDVSGILDKGGTILGTSNRDNPFNFNVMNEGQSSYADVSDKVLRNLGLFGVDCVIAIGGDGTLSIANALAQKGVKIIGVPKTIDNDLSGTDITFGFMTAVETASEAIDKLHSTAESHHRVMLLEVMGRYAGWIAIEAGIAGGADIILIPEIPYDIHKVAQKIMERKNSGKHFSIVVVAEGAGLQHDASKRGTVDDGPSSRSEKQVWTNLPVHSGSISAKISEELENLTGIETRVTVLGHLQRGGRPSPYDRILSTRFGVAAVNLVSQEKFGVMVSLAGDKVTYVTLSEATSKIKAVDPEGELVAIAKSIGVGFGD